MNPVPVNFDPVAPLIDIVLLECNIDTKTGHQKFSTFLGKKRA